MHLRIAWADRSPDCLRRLNSDADFFHLCTAHPVLSPVAVARHGLEDRMVSSHHAGKLTWMRCFVETSQQSKYRGLAWHFVCSLSNTL